MLVPMAAVLKYGLLLSFRSQSQVVPRCYRFCRGGLLTHHRKPFPEGVAASMMGTVNQHQFGATETTGSRDGNKKIMEKPYLLLNCQKGGVCGLPVEFTTIVAKHYEVISFDEFFKNKEVYSQKIQVYFMWTFENSPDRSLIQSLPNLKIVLTPGAGLDHLDLPMIFSFGIKVANTPLQVANATADLGMALMLSSARNIVEGVKIAASPETTFFTVNWVGADVSGATLGIIGMGRIGYKVAQRAMGFEMKILYHNRRRRSEEEEKAVRASYCEKIEDLLQHSDFVMPVVSLNPDTNKLIGKRELELMKPTATLINISRGEVVDQDALVEALQKGVIRAAALDVTYPEPLPRDHPLLKLKNAIVTPHIGSSTYSTNRKILERMITNGLAALAGLDIPDEVTQP